MLDDEKIWLVIYDGRRFGVIEAFRETQCSIVSERLKYAAAVEYACRMNEMQGRRGAGDFFTGLLHLGGEAAGHCVKAVKTGYSKGRG
ncbi:hypothetical protein [Brevundimonas sp.]|uniref:hypothetical protein n=1 Tax=Brevundimonas sp. TaxID=1871086 RepID=UPI001AC74F38|nr:hypothetical protein [Brevundimonas sp.]MBN9467094.1 hypothetical protein [Brevundimonas sp.]